MVSEAYLHNIIEKLVLENIEIDMFSVMEEIRSAFTPEDIFPTKDLELWAKQNGYIKGEIKWEVK